VNLLLWCREWIIPCILWILLFLCIFAIFILPFVVSLCFGTVLGLCTSCVDHVNAFHYTENKHHHCMNMLLWVSHHFTVSFFSLTFWTVSRPLVFYVGLLGSQRFANLHTRMLSSYWKAWNCFKSFHFHHKLQFPHIFYIN